MAEKNSNNSQKKTTGGNQSNYPNFPYNNFNPNFPSNRGQENYSAAQQNYFNPVNRPPSVPPSNMPTGDPHFWQTQNQPPVTPPPDKKKKLKKTVHRDWEDFFGRIFTGILISFVLVYMGWLYAPRIRNSMTFWPTKTLTPITPIPTQIFTPTVTPLATNTPTLVPTATPGPLSNYWISDGMQVDPQIPDAPDGVIVLSVDKSAEVNPSLDSGLWTSSKKIAADLGKTTYDGNWYATYSSGWVHWFMDQPLREGLYEIYTMDTVYSSGGTLDFSVKLGEQILPPLTGSQRVNYMTSQYEPQQSTDVWRSLGMYYINPSREILTVTTSWEDRDEYSIVAVDRLVIVPRRAANLSLLSKLNVSGTKYVFDDLQAEIVAGDYRITLKDEESWDDSYQLIMNPKMKISMVYTFKDCWPIGNYQLYAWMPANKGGISASVKLYSDNTVLMSDTGEEAVSVTAPASQEGSWISIGSWTTDRYYERDRKFKLAFEIPADSAGEFPIDAIALVHTAFSEQ